MATDWYKSGWFGVRTTINNASVHRVLTTATREKHPATAKKNATRASGGHITGSDGAGYGGASTRSLLPTSVGSPFFATVAGARGCLSPNSNVTNGNVPYVHSCVDDLGMWFR